MTYLALTTALNDIHPVDEYVQKAIQQITVRSTLPKGAVLLSEGQVADEIHFVEKGLVRAFYYRDQKEMTSWLAYEGRFVCPLPSYLLERPSQEVLQLLEPTTLLSMKRQDLEKLKQEHCAFNELQCRIMEQYILHYDLRVRLLLLKAEERLEGFQKALPEMYKRVPLCHIVTYLGIDPATLSRLRGAYKNKLKVS